MLKKQILHMGRIHIKLHTAGSNWIGKASRNGLQMLRREVERVRLQASFVYAGLSHQIRGYFLNWTVTALMHYENLEYHKV